MKEQGFVSNETITENNASSLVITAQFPEYSEANINVSSGVVRYGAVTFLPNIGRQADSSVVTQRTCTETLTDNYHRKNIQIFR